MNCAAQHSSLVQAVVRSQTEKLLERLYLKTRDSQSQEEMEILMDGSLAVSTSGMNREEKSTTSLGGENMDVEDIKWSPEEQEILDELNRNLYNKLVEVQKAEQEKNKTLSRDDSVS